MHAATRAAVEFASIFRDAKDWDEVVRSRGEIVNYYEFCRENAIAMEATRHNAFDPNEIERCNREFGYCGFVNCVASSGEDSFVMFTNADDVVAGHYMYAGNSSFETGTLKLWVYLARRSTWVFDVGAFTGVFALAAVTANPGCRVMAFEPSFLTYSRLLVNIRANRFDGHIAPVHAGLGATRADLDLRHPSGVYVLSSDETFVEHKVTEPWFTEKVPVFALDQLLRDQERYRHQIVIKPHFERADLIKIDVEGFEAEVIRGMRQTVEQCQPTVIVEILDNENTFVDVAVVNKRIEAILGLLGSGYHVKHIAEPSGYLSDTILGRNHLFIHQDNLSLLDAYSPDSLE